MERKMRGVWERRGFFGGGGSQVSIWWRRDASRVGGRSREFDRASRSRGGRFERGVSGRVRFIFVFVVDSDDGGRER